MRYTPEMKKSPPHVLKKFAGDRGSMGCPPWLVARIWANLLGLCPHGEGPEDGLRAAPKGLLRCGDFPCVGCLYFHEGATALAFQPRAVGAEPLGAQCMSHGLSSSLNPGGSVCVQWGPPPPGSRHLPGQKTPRENVGTSRMHEMGLGWVGGQEVMERGWMCLLCFPGCWPRRERLW